MAYIRPRDLELVDHVSALADTTSLTLTGLASETDGVYLLTGRISSAPNGVVEVQPDGIAQTGISSDWNQGADTAFGATFSSATGWIIGGGLTADASATWVSQFEAWIFPATNRHGSTAALDGQRLFHMNGTNILSGVKHMQTSFGVWTDNTYASWSTLLVGGFGSTIKRGSDIMLYKAKF